MDKRKISVAMITYGQEKYIRQAVESVLDQQIHYDFELLISDDCSPDNTSYIVNDIIVNHPKGHLINYVRHTHNKGIIENFWWTLSNCLGDYIAICEGDDYWSDPLKMQRQIDYLEINLDCSICFHATIFEFQENPKKNYVHRPKHISANNKFTIEDAILAGGGFMGTNSMMFRREYISKRPLWINNSPIGDTPLMLLLATKGNIGYIDEAMSVYRVASDGSWSSSMKSRRNRRDHYIRVLEMWDSFNKWTDFRFDIFIKQKKRINKKKYLKSELAIVLRRILRH